MCTRNAQMPKSRIHQQLGNVDYKKLVAIKQKVDESDFCAKITAVALV